MSQDGEIFADDDAEPGEIQPEMASNKVHIRGLDNLATDDVKVFARDHYPNQASYKVEWIDDTSANLVFSTDEAASEALLSFSLAPETYTAGADSLLQLTQANLLSPHPHTDLHVRMALSTDVKQPRAHDASRFYLLNPDKDPRERRHKHDDRRGGRRNQDRRPKRRREEEEDDTPFDESMYDDAPTSLSTRIERPLQARRYSASNDGRLSKRPRGASNRSVDLFAGRLVREENGSRLRNRSASPSAIADGDGRFGFKETHEEPIKSRGIGLRGSTNEHYESSQNGQPNRELFSSSSSARELFPGKPTPLKELPINKSSNELFPTKFIDTPFSTSPSHRRTDAFDVADEGPELLVRSNGHNEPQINGTVEGRLKSRSLAERITNGPNASRVQPDGLKICDAAPDNPGFSIRGAAKSVNPRVRELFPDHREGENAGKELFNGGKRGNRRRAEDLFG